MQIVAYLASSLGRSPFETFAERRKVDELPDTRPEAYCPIPKIVCDLDKAAQFGSMRCTKLSHISVSLNQHRLSRHDFHAHHLLRVQCLRNQGGLCRYKRPSSAESTYRIAADTTDFRMVRQMCPNPRKVRVSLGFKFAEDISIP